MIEKISEADQERLGKIVALAKNGSGGEKANAIRIIKKICKQHGLDFDEVMNDEYRTVKEFTISYRSNDEKEVLVCCVYRYAFLKYGDDLWGVYPKKMGFKTTPEKYIETLNAFSVLKGLYKKEKKIIEQATFLAFRKKHELFYNPTAEEWKKINKQRKGKKDTEEDLKRERMAENMSRSMEDAEIHKQLT